MTLYLTHLSQNDECQPSTGAYVIYGLQLLKNTGPKSDFLPNAKEALSRWRKLQPGGMKLPVPEEFIFNLGLWSIERHRLDYAFLSALQYDTYMPPSECIALTTHHVGYPAGGRYNRWSIVICPSELGETTKTGTADDSVMVADRPDRSWLAEAMTLYMARVNSKLFPNVTLSSYEKWCELGTRELQYKSACIKPHVLRHSGASNDVFHQRRPLQEVQKRGRWLARKSVTRYEKHALLLKRWEQAPKDKHADILRRSQEFCTALLVELRAR